MENDGRLMGMKRVEFGRGRYVVRNCARSVDVAKVFEFVEVVDG